MVVDDLLRVPTPFHRDVVLPDLERIMDEKLAARIIPLRDEMLANFDAVFKGARAACGGVPPVIAAVRSVEERLSALESAIDKVALRSELVALRDRVDTLQQRIADLESRL